MKQTKSTTHFWLIYKLNRKQAKSASQRIRNRSIRK